eukprot:Anaeramoba_ignava/a90329_2.p1 GENE.a90329_2~~a90329_2.p1  ORF type:complete len:277 (+),score=32.50 a90329_2:49-879(+)
MKFLSLFFIVISFSAFSSCQFIADGKKGNGNVVKQERSVHDFQKIKVSHGIDLYLTQGEEESLVLEMDENLLDLIKTEVENGTLKIYSKSMIWKAKSRKVYVAFKELNALNASGGSDVYGQTPIESIDFYGNLSGGSDAKMELLAKTVDFNLSGGADAKMKISCDKMSIDASGGSDADIVAKELEKCRVVLSGGADVDLKGNAHTAYFHASGGADIDANNFKVEVAEVEVSGGADVDLFVTREISASASGAGDISYRGGATVKRSNIAKSSSLTKR